jgi:hypothetical protein
MHVKKHIIVFVCCVMLGSVLLSGCQEKGTVVTDLSSKIVLDSHGLVKFANSSMVRGTNKTGGIVTVKVSWLFENIAGREINISIDVQFFDVQNKLMYNTTHYLNYMPAGYKEATMSPSNSVIYTGDDAKLVDHVIISTAEYSPS